MADLHSFEDEAALYVLDELNCVQREEFKTRLAESAELRALVQELEEGAVALAMAAPRTQPPERVWKRIERGVSSHSQQSGVLPGSWFAWRRSGWAAAAACLFGWVSYAVWVNRPHAGGLPLVAPNEAYLQQASPSLSSPAEVRNAAVLASGESNAATQLLQARTRESAALRAQVTELQTELANASELLARQHSLLTESNRLRFFELAPASNSGAQRSPVALSPQLQQALFMGMARELGWLDSESRADPDGLMLERARGTNQFPVDFVDLRPRTNFVPSPLPKADLEKQAQESALQPPATTSGPSIPAFVSGDSLIVAVDSTIAPSGSQLSFSTGGNVQAPLGTATLGSNPLVITLPLSTVAANGGSVIINVNGAGGQSQIQLVAPVGSP